MNQAISPEANFLGVDLTSSEKKPSAYAGLDSRLWLSCLGFLRSDAEILSFVQQHRPILVAIDAPLSLPKGMCCLEEGCGCQGLLPHKGRVCERELARRGISCYFTTEKSIIKQMVYRAIGIKEELLKRGHEVIEVYPYASKVRLFGKPLPPKAKQAGLEFLKERLSALIPNLTLHATTLNHDLCDAIVAAYTAYLYRQGEAEAIGDPEEGLIFVPG